VVLPVVNFDAYFGNNFSHRWLNALPEDVIVRQRDGGRGVCRYRVAEGYKDKQKRYLTTVL